MKKFKLVLLALSMLAIVSCSSDKYVVVNFEQKVSMVELALKGDKKMAKDIEENRAKILRAITNGDKIAKQEDLEWAAAYQTVDFKIAGENFSNNLRKTISDFKIDFNINGQH